MTACYLDSSALVKLATQEHETEALRHYLARHSTRLTSRVATVELPRALARKGEDSSLPTSRLVLEAIESLSIIELDEGVATRAASLGPTALRSLDAIHLASALLMGEELDEVLTYDARFADAARSAGLSVAAPA